MAGHHYTNYTPFDIDQRYQAPSPQPFPIRQSPGLPPDPNGLRRVPPISIPQSREDLWPGEPTHINSYPGPPNFSLHNMTDPANIHSPSSSYPINHEPYYIHSSAYPPFHGSPLDNRHLPHPLPLHFPPDSHMHPHRSSHPSEWNSGSQRPDTHLVSPYARNPREGVSHSPQEPSPVDFPIVKKKRKRADAAQLKILNDVYNRTAFPTTEERAELAKRLDMSARSVQIW